MKILSLIAAIFLLLSCNSTSNKTNEENASNYLDAVDKMKTGATHEVTILESIDVGTYTYIRVNENGKKYWAAISAREVQKGKPYYFKDGMMMNNFTSKQLERTFDTIIFIQEFSDKSFLPDQTTTADERNASPGKTVTRRDPNLAISTPKNGISLEELFKNRAQYKGQSVIVKGVVVKMNKMIMDKNWIHIQDGSIYQDEYDLTLTMTDEINFAVGDTVTFQGIVNLEKDFGAGYYYDIILEDAKIIDRSKSLSKI